MPVALATDVRVEVERHELPAVGAVLPQQDPVELAQLLQWVDPDVGVRADAEPDAAVEEALDGKEAVGEIRLRRRTGAHAGARGSEQIELVAVGMRRMDDGRARAEAPA